MKQFYDEHKQKVEFVGIACRDTEDAWTKAVKENELDWKHVLNQNGVNDLSRIFAVEGYPTKIIINPDGIIEGVYLGESEDFYLKLAELLNLSI